MVKNLVNKKFNKLLALKRIANYQGRKQTFYKCLCDCGNITYVDGRKLANGHTKSCGCKRKGKPNLRARKGYGESLRNRIIDSYKRNAKNKDISFRLTDKDLQKLLSGNCFYCGCVPSKTIKKKGFYGEFTYNGVDRLDNHKGYTKENSVSCCSFCNYTKNATDYNKFIKWIRQVYKHTKLYKEIDDGSN